jgi:hypothetical protein
MGRLAPFPGRLSSKEPPPRPPWAGLWLGGMSRRAKGVSAEPSEAVVISTKQYSHFVPQAGLGTPIQLGAVGANGIFGSDAFEPRNPLRSGQNGPCC